MIYFLDASALVKRYVREPGSSRVNGLVRRQGELAVSRITFAEVGAALARAWRAGRIVEKERDRGLEQLAQDFFALRVVEVRRSLVEQVTALVLRWPLRAYDGVQLACALQLKQAGAAVDFWCADGPLGSAAMGEGLRSTLL